MINKILEFNVPKQSNDLASTDNKESLRTQPIHTHDDDVIIIVSLSATIHT